MSIFANPGFYVSIFSGVCLIASEILPFLPTKGNGILHTVIKLLGNYSKKPVTETEEKRIDDLEEKISSILDKLNNINKLDP